MVRGDTEQVKVHYKGNEDDFIVMAESVEAVKKWKEDKTIPLVDVVNSFDVFHTNKYVDGAPLAPHLSFVCLSYVTNKVCF